MVVRVEDLVQWSCVQPAGWSSCLKVAPCGTNGLHKPPQISDGISIKSSEPLKDKPDSKKPWRQTSGRIWFTAAGRLSQTCLVSFPLRRPGWASEHQSAQLPAVLPLSLLAETHPGWSEGAGAAGPPPAGPGRHQGSALHPTDVLQGHLQPPDAGGQRQLLLAVQWVGQWPSTLQGYWGRYLTITSLCFFLGKDLASSWSEDDWILSFLVQDVRLSVFEGDLARGEAETAKTPRPPANQSPGSRRWRFVLRLNYSYLNLCIKPCKNN